MHARMTLGKRSMGWMALGAQNGLSLARRRAQPNVPDRLREADPSLRRSQKWRALAQCSSGVQSAGLEVAPRRHGRGPISAREGAVSSRCHSCKEEAGVLARPGFVRLLAWRPSDCPELLVLEQEFAVL